MAEAFDPYRKWLGIPAEEQPPNHYRLLGLAPFETDPDVISNASDRQMAHVRTFQSGQFARHSQRILNELAAARVCLLNRQRRAEYDAWLRRKQAGENTAAPIAASQAEIDAIVLPFSTEPDVVSQLEVRYVDAPRSAPIDSFELPRAIPVAGGIEPSNAPAGLPPLSRPVSRRSDPTLGIAIGVGALVLVAIIGLLIWMANQPAPLAEPAPNRSSQKNQSQTSGKKRGEAGKTKPGKSKTKDTLPDRSISSAPSSEGGDLGSLPEWKTNSPPASP